ncbi:hypothetical protein C2G38_2163505 [Gigaspora rosea]|uniref:Uncharacterized protein n=1 Tax=Gigaspora rosea TaxID=44941 RepID=A0A397VV02_9GLOM|nr:hypothetical protein C2G38_2163505 [Gigaspora rosea]
MSEVDVIGKAQPYQQILEKNLWNDIVKKFIVQSRPVSSKILPPRIISTSTLPIRVTEPFSMVINDKHAAEIASWVDRKNEAYSVKGTDEIFGGYNPVGWDKLAGGRH